MTVSRTWPRQLRTALTALVAMTLLTGLLYPLLVWGIGQLAFGWQANGSLLERDGQVVGARHIGQPFDGDRWFHPRPSAAGDGYDSMASGGSNLGPENRRLINSIERNRASIAERNGVRPGQVPPDAVTASSSGLDPHISPAYATIQVDRVAQARDLSPATVRGLVAEHTDGRMLGFLGEPVVNVLQLNLELDQAR